MTSRYNTYYSSTAYTSPYDRPSRNIKSSYNNYSSQQQPYDDNYYYPQQRQQIQSSSFQSPSNRSGSGLRSKKKSPKHQPLSSPKSGRKRPIGQWKQKKSSKKHVDQQNTISLQNDDITGTTKHGKFTPESIEASLSKNQSKNQDDIKKGVFYHHDPASKKNKTKDATSTTKSSKNTTKSDQNTTATATANANDDNKDINNNNDENKTNEDDKQYMLTRISNRAPKRQIMGMHPQVFSNMPPAVPPNYEQRIKSNKRNNIDDDAKMQHNRKDKSSSSKKSKRSKRQRQTVTVSPIRYSSNNDIQAIPPISPYYQPYRAGAPPPPAPSSSYYFDPYNPSYNQSYGGGSSGYYGSLIDPYRSGPGVAGVAAGTGSWNGNGPPPSNIYSPGYHHSKGRLGDDGSWYPYDNVGDIDKYNTPRRVGTRSRVNNTANVDLTTPISTKRTKTSTKTSSKTSKKKKSPPITINLSPGKRVNRIQKQLEYYLSYDNLTNDEYLTSIMDENGYISVNEIVKFHRMNTLGADKSMIIEAAYHSVIIEVDMKTKNKVRPSKHWNAFIKKTVEKSKNKKINNTDNKEVTTDTIEQIVANIQKQQKERKARRKKKQKQKEKEKEKEKQKDKDDKKTDNDKNDPPPSKLQPPAVSGKIMSSSDGSTTDDVSALIAQDKAENNDDDDVGDPANQDMIDID